MRKSRSLAKVSERRLQPLLVWDIIEWKLGLSSYHRAKREKGNMAPWLPPPCVRLCLQTSTTGTSLWSFASPEIFDWLRHWGNKYFFFKSPRKICHPIMESWCKKIFCLVANLPVHSPWKFANSPIFQNCIFWLFFKINKWCDHSFLMFFNQEYVYAPK